MNTLLDPLADDELKVLLQLDQPAIHSVWQDGPLNAATAWIQTVCRSEDASMEVLRPDDRSWIDFLEQRDPLQSNIRVLIVEGGLSVINREDRPLLNQSLRERLQRLPQLVFLVEPSRQERRLKEDFANVFAIIGSSFYMGHSVFDDDDLFG